MNCEQACHLLDDYLEDDLRRYDRQRLEVHLASCSKCVEELRTRSAFDQAIRQALTASVQQQTLSPEARARMIQVAQSNVRQAIWSNYVRLTLRAMGSVSAIVLVFVGLYFLMQRVPSKIGASPAILLPVNQLALSERGAALSTPLSRAALPELEPVTQDAANRPALTLSNSDVHIQPGELHPREWFTITLLLHSDSPQPADTARFDLEVNGPSGYYRFPLTMKGPLPAHGVSIFQVTPDHLADLCEKQYLMSPTDVFNQPGTYTVRVTVFSPASNPQR